MSIIQEATENSSGQLEMLINIVPLSIYNIVLPIPQLPKEGEVSINVKNFPDSAFREYVKTEFDKNGNDVLSVAELEAATYIDITGNTQIKSVKGIEYFTSLEGLECRLTSVESLDLTSNKKLKELNCAHNQNLTSLDIMGLEELEGLYLSDTGIKDLSLKSNKKLNGLICMGDRNR